MFVLSGFVADLQDQPNAPVSAGYFQNPFLHNECMNINYILLDFKAAICWIAELILPSDAPVSLSCRKPVTDVKGATGNSAFN